jgi:hypothetical protein
MDTPLIKYHTWLFINGRQVGDNHTFADWYADDAAAIEDARSYFTAEGYAVESIQAEEREVRAASPLAPALVGKVLIVRLSTPSKPS